MKRRAKILISSISLLTVGGAMVGTSIYVGVTQDKLNVNNEKDDNVENPNTNGNQNPSEDNQNPSKPQNPGEDNQKPSKPDKPSETPDNSSTPTIKGVKIVNELGPDYHNYEEGQELRLNAIIYSDQIDKIQFKELKYKWHRIDDGKDKIIPDQTSRELVMPLSLEDDGMDIYVQVWYGSSHATSDDFRVNVSVTTDIPENHENENQNTPVVPPTIEGIDPSWYDVDLAKAPSLPTPSGFTSWKNKLEVVKPTPISSNAIGDVVKKLTWESIEKEMVYQARFVLFQSFDNNFSEVNYYSRKVNDNVYEVFAEGILKDDVVNGKAPIQYRGTFAKNEYNATKGQTIKVKFTVSKNDWKAIETNGEWSFTNKSTEIDSTKHPEYLVQMPSTRIDVFKDNESIVSFNDMPVPRAYSFVLGRSKVNK